MPCTIRRSSVVNVCGLVQRGTAANYRCAMPVERASVSHGSSPSSITDWHSFPASVRLGRCSCAINVMGDHAPESPWLALWHSPLCKQVLHGTSDKTLTRKRSVRTAGLDPSAMRVVSSGPRAAFVVARSTRHTSPRTAVFPQPSCTESCIPPCSPASAQSVAWPRSSRSVSFLALWHRRSSRWTGCPRSPRIPA